MFEKSKFNKANSTSNNLTVEELAKIIKAIINNKESEFVGGKGDDSDTDYIDLDELSDDTKKKKKPLKRKVSKIKLPSNGFEFKPFGSEEKPNKLVKFNDKKPDKFVRMIEELPNDVKSLILKFFKSDELVELIGFEPIMFDPEEYRDKAKMIEYLQQSALFTIKTNYVNLFRVAFDSDFGKKNPIFRNKLNIPTNLDEIEDVKDRKALKSIRQSEETRMMIVGGLTFYLPGNILTITDDEYENRERIEIFKKKCIMVNNLFILNREILEMQTNASKALFLLLNTYKSLTYLSLGIDTDDIYNDSFGYLELQYLERATVEFEISTKRGFNFGTSSGPPVATVLKKTPKIIEVYPETCGSTKLNYFLSILSPKTDTLIVHLTENIFSPIQIGRHIKHLTLNVVGNEKRVHFSIQGCVGVESLFINGITNQKGTSNYVDFLISSLPNVKHITLKGISGFCVGTNNLFEINSPIQNVESVTLIDISLHKNFYFDEEIDRPESHKIGEALPNRTNELFGSLESFFRYWKPNYLYLEECIYTQKQNLLNLMIPRKKLIITENYEKINLPSWIGSFERFFNGKVEVEVKIPNL